MARFVKHWRAWSLALLAGTMPLGTVATCDYGSSGGTLFYDRFDDDYDEVVIIDGGHGGYYYDDYYYEDEIIIIEDDYCGDYFWDCWW